MMSSLSVMPDKLLKAGLDISIDVDKSTVAVAVITLTLTLTLTLDLFQQPQSRCLIRQLTQ
jgi:hypothetical protein